LAYAWERDRVLLTHDEGFLEDKRHAPEVNPGLVVMPGGSGDVERFLPLIGDMLAVMKSYRGLWLQTKTHIQAGGVIAIKGINATSKERIPTWLMTFDRDGNALQWIPE